MDVDQGSVRLAEGGRNAAEDAPSPGAEGRVGVHVRAAAYSLVLMRNLLASPVGVA